MGKVILVIGVFRGIGKFIVDVFFSLDKDMVVYGVVRFEVFLKKLKEKYGDRFFYVVGDIIEDFVLKQLVNVVVKGYGKIDFLVVNVGVLEFV